MNAEWVSAAATVGTFLVVLASAVGVFVQLRHTRGSNQITALTECRETLESEEFGKALRFVGYELPQLLRDPTQWPKIAATPLAGEYLAIDIVGNFFESMGNFVKNGIIDRQIVCDVWSAIILRSWRSLAPVIAYYRSEAGDELWENFEYLAVLAQRYTAAHPSSYPRGWPRMVKETSFLDAMKGSG
jgi:hypothetical protein